MALRKTSYVPLETPFSTHALDAWESNIKYRLWFAGFVWYMAGDGATPEWETIFSEASVFWLWEDEDEEYIKEFSRTLRASYWIPFDLDESRKVPTRITATPNPLANLTPPTRLRFVAWLMVAGPILKDRILKPEPDDLPHIGMLIHDWGTLVLSDSEAAGTCGTCSVSHLLPVWIKTLSQIYALEDLESLPWSHECHCLSSQLSACPRPHVVPLEKHSPILHILYELVVPPWVLIHWVTFRTAVTVVLNDQTVPLAPFLELIRGLNEELFAQDVDDNLELCRNLRQDTRPTLYPQNWIGYMVEIPLKTWQEISNIINRTADRPRRASMRTRLAAMFLTYSCTEHVLQRILVSFDTGFEYSLRDFVACVVDSSYNLGERPKRINFNSLEFWASPNLEKWLSARRENLCRTMWNHSPQSSAVERVEDMVLVLDTLPQNLTIYAYYHRLRYFRPSNEHGWQWGSGFLVGLSHYCDNVKILLRVVKDLAVKISSSSTHEIARDVHKHMYIDLSAVVARLVLFLRDQKSRRSLSVCRGQEAQRLLDFLQDLHDLDSFPVSKPLVFRALRRLSRSSGLHPRCFILPGLQRLGQQVAGGGFGDIWKGLVGGQNVCVKVMRIFGNSNITAALKEFGREAVIWRQLYHPNVLPFFGLYYVENRLCLVSPWMGDGHVVQFIRNHKPNDTKRLSLILDVALGLQYLHGQKVVHGDLKGLNILITPSHRACIADFGVASIADNITVRFTHSTVTARAGTARYQAPELFRIENTTKIHYGSDIYAFACVCYEILTGQVPFHEFQNDMAVMMKVAAGYRPPRPTSCSGVLDLWELLRSCWEGEAEKRPTALEVVEQLVGPSIGAKPTPVTSDWDEKFTSKFRRSVQGEPWPLLPSVLEIECMLFGEEKAQACRECYPDQETANNEQTSSPLARQPKRRYEEEPAESNPEDTKREQPEARNSKRKRLPDTLLASTAP